MLDDLVLRWSARDNPPRLVNRGQRRPQLRLRKKGKDREAVVHEPTESRRKEPIGAAFVRGVIAK